MTHKRSWLREFLVVLGLFAALGLLGFLNLAHSRREKNEKNARALLRAFHLAQTEFRAQDQNDRDQDAEGEFGGLDQLLGLKQTWSYRQFDFFGLPVVDATQGQALEDLQQVLRVPPAASAPSGASAPKPAPPAEPGPGASEAPPPVPPRVLSETPHFLLPTQELVFDGYVYRVLLPQLQQDTKTMTEDDKIKAKTDEVEKYWCAYAWPRRYGRSGRWSYFIDFNGRLYTRDDPQLTGTGRTGLRAIDAYEGREFESPVDQKRWPRWADVQPKPKPPKPSPETPAGPEPGAEPGSPAGPAATAGTPPTTPGPALPSGGGKEDQERRQKLLEEIGSETEGLLKE